MCIYAHTCKNENDGFAGYVKLIETFTTKCCIIYTPCKKFHRGKTESYLQGIISSNMNFN